MKKLPAEHFSLRNINVDEIVSLLEPIELALILQGEEYNSDVDIMLENMLDYFVEEELYEYAVCCRDEINFRNDLKIKRKPTL